MRACILATVITLVVSAAGAVGAQGSPGEPPVLRVSSATFFELRQRAADARTAKRYAEADSLYEILTTNYPLDSDLWEARGIVQSARGNASQAIASWETAWRAGGWPRGEVAYIVARLHAQLGHGTVAMDWIDSALVNRLERRPRLLTDSAFIAIRNEPRFKRQTGEVTAGVNRVDGWRADIAYFVDEAQRLHGGRERQAFSSAFLAAAKDLTRDVPKLSDAEVGLGLVRLARMLGDGHSYLVPRAPIAPVQFYRFSDGLYIVNGSPETAELIGAKVLRVGSVTADSAIRAIAATASSDNMMTPLWLGMDWLSIPTAMRALHINDDSTAMHLEIVDAKGKQRSVTLPAGMKWGPPRMLQAPAMAAAPAPLWLQHVAEKHWLTALPAMRAVYAQYNEVRNDAKGTVAQFADSVTALLASSKATSLIVDVRHNHGGNRRLNTPLLLAMGTFRRADPNNRVFIITARGTFSAAQVFISQAEWMADPIYVGEPSGSKPNFVGEETGVVLPWSGMRGSVSSQFHQGGAPQDERPFIVPQIPVTLSAADFFANRDPALAAIEEVLAGRSRTIIP